MANAQTTEGGFGVAFFGESSLEADFEALMWACKHLRVSNERKLKIIHVLNNGNEAQELPGLRYGSSDLKSKFPGYIQIEKLQTELNKEKQQICGVTYEGENFEKALQKAIEKERLDTLVLAWWVEDDRKGPPVNCTLESERCSIIHAKVHSERKLTFSMAPAATTAAPPPSSTAPALTETAGIATLAAQPEPSMEVSTVTAPPAASTEENN